MNKGFLRYTVNNEHFPLVFLEGLISESGEYSIPNTYFKRTNSATYTQGEHSKSVSDWVPGH